ncbi:MAG: AAA family ATPase [Synergistaceae bacterium]|nr:AAA family ATPase [Synergistaceae bacterium]
MEYFSQHEIEAQLLDDMRSLHIEPIGNISLQLDGQIHRYKVAGDKGSQTAGAYCIWTDHWPAGWLYNWRTGDHSKWCFNRDNLSKEKRDALSDAQYQELLEKAKIAQEKALEEIKLKQLQASDKARSIFSALPPAPDDHPYLICKNVSNYGLSYRNDLKQLAIPLRNINGDIQSIQWIDTKGEKRFQPDAPTKAAFFSVGLDLLAQEQFKNTPILIGEGYATIATVHELTGFPCVAAMTCHNLKLVAEAINAKFPLHKIIFIADNDHLTDGNPGLSCANEACSSLRNSSVIFPEFSKNETGSDWNDFFHLHGPELTAYILKDKIKFALLPKKTQELLKRVEVVNAQILRQTVLPPLKWAIEGFLPAGLTILAGSPKVGKSILALHIALAVATGGCALGKIFVQQGDVLYLALEDNKRRIQERINGSDLDADTDISRLDIAYTVPRQNEGGLAYIEFWLINHKEARLVIIDTLQMFRTQLSGKGHMYSEDYDVISEIKKLADKYDVPFLIIHHLKKAKENEDWINEISGSQGIAGAADTLFSLKRSRTQAVGILHRNGRDVEE